VKQMNWITTFRNLRLADWISLSMSIFSLAISIVSIVFRSR
jgi:hypothetical protein